MRRPYDSWRLKYIERVRSAPVRAAECWCALRQSGHVVPSCALGASAAVIPTARSALAALVMAPLARIHHTLPSVAPPTDPEVSLHIATFSNKESSVIAGAQGGLTWIVRYSAAYTRVSSNVTTAVIAPAQGA